MSIQPSDNPFGNIPKISVIIPVYGVERFIERCARSLFSQTLDDIEYLFINDCTPDRSIDILLQILEDYPSRKKQVRIINMEHNSGQAAVRLKGMIEAKGEYQIHCDSDDWVEPEMYEKMYKRALSSGADVVSCNYWREEYNSRSLEVRNLDYTNPRRYIICDYQGTWWTLWNRLTRSQLIRDYAIYPTPGMNMWEDMYVNLRVYYYANRLSHIAEPLYHYDATRDGRISSNPRSDGIVCQKKLCIEYLEEFFSSVNFDASVFINYRKCLVKNGYLLSRPVDYVSFKKCYPEMKDCKLNRSWAFNLCWRCAASGIFLPHRLYVKYVDGKNRLRK